MNVDSLLQLHVYLQERTREGEIKKYHVIWPNWTGYKTVVEESYISEIPIKHPIFPCFTYEIYPSQWASRQAVAYPTDAKLRHFVLLSESLGIEVLSLNEPVVNEVLSGKEWSEITPQAKSRVLIASLEQEEVDRALGQNQ